MNKLRVIVIGNGMVGYKFCEKLKSKSNSFKLIVFGEESRQAYDRVHLSEYFNGKTAAELSMSTASWYEEQEIDLYLNNPVTGVDRMNKRVSTLSGENFDYDFLVFATGSAAFVPNIKGIGKGGVFVYRTIDDLDLIADYSKSSKKASVIGGGLLGLEAAKALIDLGIEETSIIEFAPRLMPRQIDMAGSEMLKSMLIDLGLQIHLNKNTSSIEGETNITGLKFSDDTVLAVDMLVISAGIKPRDELARQCGIAVGPRGGIVVDSEMQTNDPCILLSENVPFSRT